MNIDLYWDNDSFISIDNNDEESIKTRIQELDELIDIVSDSGDSIFKSLDLYSAPIANGIDLATWLYENNSSYGLEEHKRLLSKLVEQASIVKEDKYEKIKLCIDTKKIDEPNAFISMYVDSDNKWYIKNKFEWSEVHRYYLPRVNNIEEFMREVEICFFNLYFHDNVRKSLNTLNYSFNSYKQEIIKHLSELNDNFKLIYEKYHSQGYTTVAAIFTSQSDVACSAENDRETAKNRIFTFISCAGEEMAVNCELHTKFETFRKDKDRLYFNPGNQYIEDGKILIAHIGDHLD